MKTISTIWIPYQHINLLPDVVTQNEIINLLAYQQGLMSVLSVSDLRLGSELPRLRRAMLRSVPGTSLGLILVC